MNEIDLLDAGEVSLFAVDFVHPLLLVDVPHWRACSEVHGCWINVIIISPRLVLKNTVYEGESLIRTALASTRAAIIPLYDTSSSECTYSTVLCYSASILDRDTLNPNTYTHTCDAVPGRPLCDLTYSVLGTYVLYIHVSGNVDLVA